MTTTHPQPVEIPTDPHALFGALATLAVEDAYPCLDDIEQPAPSLHTLTAGTVYRTVIVRPVAGAAIRKTFRVISSRPR